MTNGPFTAVNDQHNTWAKAHDDHRSRTRSLQFSLFHVRREDRVLGTFREGGESQTGNH